ncbi:ribosome hibernation factor-recruiting GTPase MRF [Mycolicibacterium tokaiense]|uniref:Cobalamin synthesis protein n=1 Tax=Mycolicibacterium tokaiense TaxID=39695 RepID=A0A378TEX3_9MYCO|nr:GTP-binding protein [Mycolicibacterium tokaiense]BBY86201.1 putative cobalamin synthesis protein [Mycolicibacterium tokaiense]STZ59289.1 cobalamin synthesis protein [Mycolicibacterium tokaiense]
MRTPVVLVAGLGDTDATSEVLAHQPGTLLIRHRFDGHVVRRSLTTSQHLTAEVALELAHGCVACTIRNDLLILLRRVHRRDDVTRIVVALPSEMEPEPVCFAINRVPVRVGPGYIDGPAARDVRIHAVVVCVDADSWLATALGDEELPDGRTAAQVAVCQAEFADVLVVPRPQPVELAVLRRLAPRARITADADRVEMALANLEPDARRGRSDHPHGPLLAGQPPLAADGPVKLVEFSARRPFHPARLHEALDRLLDGVVRARGRLWLASRSEHAMYLESAGGGLRVSNAGKWLAAMTSGEMAYVDPERRALADLMWEHRFGDRHTSMAVLVCGADPAEISAALHHALLTDDEMNRPNGWAEYPDPFGDWHTEPCTAADDLATESTHSVEGDR